jgi:hypothetical protein
MTSNYEVEEAARLTVKLASNPKWEQDIAEVLAYLEASEADTLALIAYLQNPKVVPRPPNSGDIEFGFVLYWIHYPPPEVQKYLDDHWLLRWIYDVIKVLAPATKITPEQYAAIEADFDGYGEPGADGTMYGRKQYQQLDKRWMLSFLNYVINVADPGSVTKLPNLPTKPIALHAKDRNVSGGVVLGIVGDWGTGYYPDEGGIHCPAQRVMEQLTDRTRSPVPDYLIHLGDVYYAGTDLRPPPGEEQTNFTNLWADQGTGRNFTLNSNHEMYGADAGYFDVALADPKFSGQQGMSYFAMTYGKWLVLGLDSAYYSDALNGRAMYMAGAIGAAGFTQQIDWLKQFRAWQGPVMIMTHHGAADTITADVYPLYQQVAAALQRAPTLWYWGHVHNGIVYNQLFTSKTAPKMFSFTKGRCCGHGAIPFGKAWGLEDPGGKQDPNVAYFAHTPDIKLPNTIGPDPVNPRVRNGYALVTLQADGGCSEAFYETDIVGPVWQNSWSAAELAAE